MLVNCAHCNKELNRKPYFVKKYKHSFCNHSCKNQFQTKYIQVKCNTCQKPLTRTLYSLTRNSSGNFYCNHSCAAKSRNRFVTGENHCNYKTGLYRYRQKALEYYGPFCMNPSCLLTKLIKIPIHMLDVDHVDEDRKNNKIENLKVLCVWCHALKTRRHRVKI